jgi:hypothetical protein
VAHFLRGLDQLLDEPDRADEVAALERLGDRVAVALPALALREPGLDRLIVEQVQVLIHDGEINAAWPTAAGDGIVGA